MPQRAPCNRHQAESGPDSDVPITLWAETYGWMLALHIQRMEWERCGDVVERAKRDVAIGFAKPSGDILTRPLAQTELDDDPLGVRIINTLEEHDIRTVAELLQKTREQLIALPNFGVTALHKIFQMLEGLGLRPLPIQSGELTYAGFPKYSPEERAESAQRRKERQRAVKAQLQADGLLATPARYTKPRAVKRITKRLLDAGYTADEIVALYGEKYRPQIFADER